MSSLFGLQSGSRELAAYTGRPEQLYGVRLAELTEGAERGVRIADLRSGGGLSFTVLLDRGMDIGPAEFRGVPLAYLAPGNGFAHPAGFDATGLGWLRSWGGGLLTGCGLRNVGSPCATEDGEAFSLHGRLSHLAARNVRHGETLDAGERCLFVEGELTEARLFGENLCLRRRILVPIGGASLRVRDTVVNQGFRSEPVFLLYHHNLGFPVVAPDSTLEAVEHPVTARDAVSDVTAWARLQPPTPGYDEQAFYHQVPAGADGFARITLRSPRAGLRVEVAWRTAELPLLTHWKMMGEGGYVVGIEPCNTQVGGRAAELARGPHCVLAPGESREFAVNLQIITRA